MIDAPMLVGFAAAAIRVSTPLGLAAIGETIAERAGVLNLGIEGAMLAGAFCAALGASHDGVAVGVLVAAIGGLLVALAFAGIAVAARADQVIAGTAITLGATGLTGLLAQRLLATPNLSLPILPVIPIPLLGDIPGVGGVFFRQTVLTYIGYLLVPLAAWLVWRTRFGLQLRASGESPAAALAAGVPVGWIRSIAVLIGGTCAGLAGAALVLAQVGTFTERMTAGRGFIAIAIVALGRWNPWGVGGAAILFGGATALQYTFQAAGSRLPYQLFIALPYLLALSALGLATGRHRGPAALGQPH
ncbi:MAG: ABC transporter permease [Gemmatimonadales bacterium]